MAAIFTEAASSNVRLSGFMTNARSAAHAYSANAPRQPPNTSAPGLNCVTFPPTPSTSPAPPVSWLDLLYVPATRSPRARHINPQTWDLWLAQPGHEADEVRRAPHEVPVKWIDRSRANSNQNLIVPSGRLFDFYTFQNIG